MNNYYADKLNAQSLFQVYDTAIPRIKQYLDAEIDFVRQNLTGSEDVLELAAGYGRIVKELAPPAPLSWAWIFPPAMWSWESATLQTVPTPLWW